MADASRKRARSPDSQSSEYAPVKKMSTSHRAKKGIARPIQKTAPLPSKDIGMGTAKPKIKLKIAPPKSSSDVKAPVNEAANIPTSVKPQQGSQQSRRTMGSKFQRLEAQVAEKDAEIFELKRQHAKTLKEVDALKKDFDMKTQAALDAYHAQQEAQRKLEIYENAYGPYEPQAATLRRLANLNKGALPPRQL